MIYFSLGLLAVIFALLGFLLHAFCFAVSEDPELREEVEFLRAARDEKQREAREAQEEIIKTSTNVRSLENQLRQRSEEIENLQRMAARQDEEIAHLRKEAATIRAAVAPFPKAQNVRQEEPSPPLAASAKPEPYSTPFLPLEEAPVSRSEDEKAQQKAQAPPVWRENLNNIIDILDAMEKEVEK